VVPSLREAIVLGAGILTIVISVALIFVAQDSELAVAPAVAA
jgi:hypothetical protein